MNHYRRLAVLALVSIVAAVIVWSQPPLAQDPAYHAFVDSRALGGVPNWQNVLSNIPFVLVGAYGLAEWWRRFRINLGAPERAGWFCLFFGILLTGFGSAYYHWNPNNQTLVWDRLPMALSFTALFAAIIGERISHHAYRWLLWPLAGIGVASVLYWSSTELRGVGDLRLYVMVQFLPLLMIPLVMALYRPRWTHGRLVFWALAFYALAKAAEVYDREVFAALWDSVSGHALKHLLAATGCWMLVMMYDKRQPLPST